MSKPSRESTQIFKELKSKPKPLKTLTGSSPAQDCSISQVALEVRFEAAVCAVASRNLSQCAT